MSFAYPWAGLATVAALLTFVWTAILVGRARRRFGIAAPATTGDPGFERVFRVQSNTLEQIVLFLPSLWLAATVFSDRWAGILGAVWVLGRIVYAIGYAAEAKRRTPGFLMTVSASFILLILAVFGILRGLA